MHFENRPIVPGRGLAVGKPDGKRRLAMVDDGKAGIKPCSGARKCRTATHCVDIRHGQNCHTVDRRNRSHDCVDDKRCIGLAHGFGQAIKKKADVRILYDAHRIGDGRCRCLKHRRNM